MSIDLDISLKAENSTGSQSLQLTANDGEYWFTLAGDYKGSPIQIDFDTMSRHELEEVRALIDIILASSTGADTQ